LNYAARSALNKAVNCATTSEVVPADLLCELETARFALPEETAEDFLK
jgi:hypothetical protein